MKRASFLVAALLLAARCAFAAGDPAALVAQAKALDWTDVFAGSERLVYLGERHVDVRPKDELVQALRKAAAAGFTHLALEMLGEGRRGLLERFAAGRATEAEVANAFAQDWGPEDKGFMPRDYARVVAAAQAAGLRVEPLDLTPEDKRQAWESCAQDQSDDECDGKELQTRDDRMRDALAALLAKPGTGRVLAWTGGWHSCRLEQAAGLAAKGVASRSYFVITRGGKYERATDIADYQKAIDARGRAGERLLIETGQAQACFDGLIALP